TAYAVGHGVLTGQVGDDGLRDGQPDSGGCVHGESSISGSTRSGGLGTGYHGRPCRITVFTSVISATAERGPSLPIPLPLRPPYGIRSARQRGVQLMWITPASISRIARTAPATSEVNTPAPRPYAVPLACAMALCQSSAIETATAGANSPSWLNGDAGSTPATTAGEITAPSRCPPVSRTAPAPTAAWMERSTRCASSTEMSVPIRVVADLGSPVSIFSTWTTRASKKSVAIEGCVIT